MKSFDTLDNWHEEFLKQVSGVLPRSWLLALFVAFIDVLADAFLNCFVVNIVTILIISQANPADPRTFPFILLGNKIDIDGGNSRVVSLEKFLPGTCFYVLFYCLI